MDPEDQKEISPAAHLEKAATTYANRMEKAVNNSPEWIYPRIFLKAPATAFSFPNYPGLSVALRYYIIAGKVGWWISTLLIFLAGIFLVQNVVSVLLQGEVKMFFIMLLILLAIGGISFLWLLFTNLLLAMQFAFCEFIVVIVKMEGHAAKTEGHLALISGRQRKVKREKNT